MATRMAVEEVRTFLSPGTRTGKLAWSGASGQPYVAPIWFNLDETPKGSRAIPSGSRTESPEPYGASSMAPCSMPSSSSLGDDFSNSPRSA